MSTLLNSVIFFFGLIRFYVYGISSSIPSLPAWSFQRVITGGSQPPPCSPRLRSGPGGPPTITQWNDEGLPAVTQKSPHKHSVFEGGFYDHRYSFSGWTRYVTSTYSITVIKFFSFIVLKRISFVVGLAKMKMNTLSDSFHFHVTMDIEGIPYCHNKSKCYNAFSCNQIFFVDRGLIDSWMRHYFSTITGHNWIRG
jgi:hypothetical protein